MSSIHAERVLVIGAGLSGLATAQRRAMIANQRAYSARSLHCHRTELNCDILYPEEGHLKLVPKSFWISQMRLLNERVVRAATRSVHRSHVRVGLSRLTGFSSMKRLQKNFAHPKAALCNASAYIVDLARNLSSRYTQGRSCTNVEIKPLRCG